MNIVVSFLSVSSVINGFGTHINLYSKGKDDLIHYVLLNK